MARRPKCGDVLELAWPDGPRVFVRVLLDVRSQCVKPKLVRPEAPLFFFGDAFLVDVAEAPDAAEPILSPMLTFAWPCPKVGQCVVDPRRVSFPQSASMYRQSLHFNWGELSLPLVGLGQDDMYRIGVMPTLAPIPELTLHKLGRKDLIGSMFPNPEVFNPVRQDLQLSEHRAEIHARLGRRISESYYETALRYGYDLARFYGEQYRNRELTLCPYCHAPFDTSPLCPTCGEDTRNDAPLAMTAQELAEARRLPCQACETPILSTAVICPGCFARQKS